MLGFLLSALSLKYLPSLEVLYIGVGLLVGSGYACIGLVSVGAIHTHFTRYRVFFTRQTGKKCYFWKIICPSVHPFRFRFSIDKLVDCRNIGIGMGIMSSGAGVGQLIFSPLLQLSLDNYGMFYTFIIMGLSMLLCLLPVAIIHCESKRVLAVSSDIKKEKALSQIYKEIFSSADVVLLLIYLGSPKIRP